MAEKPQEDPQRWTAKRRVALVVSILKGETSVQEAARKHGLKVAESRTGEIDFSSVRKTHFGRAPRTKKP